VLAGDLSNDAVRTWPTVLTRLGRLIGLEKVVIVPGNHDYYCDRIDGEHLMREVCSDFGVRFAQKEEIRVGSTQVLCCTLWSDFALNRDVRGAVETARRAMNDYRMIRIGVPGMPFGQQQTRLLTPQDTLALHQDHRSWLEAALRAPHFAGEGGQTVVVTHHGPSPATVAGIIDDLTPSFHTDLNDLILETAPVAWFFGHSHRRCQATVGRTDIRNVSVGYPHEVGAHTTNLRDLIFFETD
jgi:Icc-related predicted phosphoesterase